MVYPEQRDFVRQDFRRAGALYQSGQFQAAAAAYQNLLTTDPNFVPALHMLGRIALQSGDVKAAVRHLSRAIKLLPENPTIINDFAVALVSSGEVDRAADMFRRLIRLQPDNPDGYRNLGLFQITNKRYGSAVPTLQKYIEMAPGDGDGHALLATAFYYTGQLKEALKEQKLAAEAKPDAAGPCETLGLIRLRQGRVDEAVAAFDEALARNPKLASAMGNKGQALASVGRFDEARAALKSALELDPLAMPFLQALVDFGPFREDDDRKPFLERAEIHMSALDDAAQTELHMALGKANDDQGHVTAAMAHWQAASALRRKHVQYDEAKELGQLADIARQFSPQMLAAHQEMGVPSELPVFIVGMPRSGTSLTEQILASHPAVFGAGECVEWNHLIARDRLGADFPSRVATLPAERWRDVGAYYLKNMRKQAPDALRVTDKMPSNFRWLGAMHIALPQAKFIYVRRNPADCALSCFSKNFPVGFTYTSDLGELGRYMRACETLMAHWRNVLPPECFLEVVYEELVQDFDRVARQMLRFVGLEWDDACARFYETRRQVTTASIYSVRQPISTKAVGRAAPYKSMLRPFCDAYAGGAAKDAVA